MAIVNKQTLLELQKRSTDTPALYKYTKLGQICSTKRGKSDSWYQDFFIDNLERMASQLHIPRLNKYGVTPADIENIIATTSNKNNPVQFDLEQLGKIIQARV
jgi:alcohol dehydrogenase class IV